MTYVVVSGPEGWSHRNWGWEMGEGREIDVGEETPLDALGLMYAKGR